MIEDKVDVHLLLNKEVVDILGTKAIGFDGFNPGKRGRGEFISQLIMRRWEEVQLARDADHIIIELSKQADLLEAAHNRSNAVVAAKLVRLAIDLLSE